jgi:hypothetical protein
MKTLLPILELTLQLFDQVDLQIQIDTFLMENNLYLFLLNYLN